MDGAALQALNEAVESVRFAAEHYFANGIVVRQHADNDLTIEEIGHGRCGLEAEGGELAHLLRPTARCDHLNPIGGKVGGHCHAHMAESDKANSAFSRRLAFYS